MFRLNDANVANVLAELDDGNFQVAVAVVAVAVAAVTVAVVIVIAVVNLILTSKDEEVSRTDTSLKARVPCRNSCL